MQMTMTDQSGVAVLAVAGSMDAATVAEFDERWKEALAAGTQKMVVDLSGIEYISSAGLRGILLLAKTAMAKKVSLAFSGMTGMVEDIFKLSGFFTILKTYPDAASAVAALA